MKRLFFRYWFILPLIILVIVAREWVEPPEPVIPPQPVDMAGHQADYYLESFTTRKYNEDGSPHYQVSGDRLIHYPADDSSEIIAPALNLSREGGIWTIEAERGHLTAQPEVFTLLGDVSMSRFHPDDENSRITIQTRDLKLHTIDNRVETDQPIAIEAGNWVLRSVGLESSINDGILTLLSKVEGRYEIVR